MKAKRTGPQAASSLSASASATTAVASDRSPKAWLPPVTWKTIG